MPVNTAMVRAPAFFPALTSITESPTTAQSRMFMFKYFAHLVKASGEGFGFEVSLDVSIFLKYLDKPNFDNSFLTSFSVTLRLVMTAKAAFDESFSSVQPTFKKRLVLLKSSWNLDYNVRSNCTLPRSC